MRKTAKSNPIIQFLRNIKNGVIYILNILFALSIACHFLEPSQFLFVAPFGLIFIPLVLLHVLIFILYFRRRKFLSLASLVLLIISCPFIPRTLNFHVEDEGEGLKIASWNVKSFDRYNWTKKKNTREKMLRFIEKEDCDILCVQEFYTNEARLNNIQSLKEIGYPHYCFYPVFKNKSGDNWGLAIFSKYPIQSAKQIALHHEWNKMNGCIEAKIKVKGQLYTVRNAHFQSIHLDYEDYNYIQDVKDEWNFHEPMKAIALIKKIILAYSSRERQVKEYLSELSPHSAKTILCCDLNDIPNSYAYSQLSRHTKDAFVEKGRGFSNTIAILLATYRIDYIFSSSDVHIHSYKRLRSKLSDHHFIYAWVE